MIRMKAADETWYESGQRRPEVCHSPRGDATRTKRHAVEKSWPRLLKNTDFIDPMVNFRLIQALI
jgi:hypothetical protein